MGYARQSMIPHISLVTVAGLAAALLVFFTIATCVTVSAQWGQAAGLAVLALAVCARAK